MPFFNSPAGAGGAPTLSGVGAPTSSLGVDGQLYIDTESSVLYGPKTAMGWGSGIQLTGASWEEVTGKPAAFPPSSHSHVIADVTGLSVALDGKAAASHVHVVGDVTGLQAAIDGKAAATHTHAISAVTGLQAAIDGKANLSHTHAVSDVTGLQSSLDGKAAASHQHQIADVTGLQAVLDGKQASGTYATLVGGTVPVAQLAAAGTASASTFLRGDGTWATAGSTNAGDLTSGTLDAARLPLATTNAAGAVVVGAGLAIAGGVLSVTGGGGSANIVEAATASGFPATGSAGTLYHAIDVKRLYFWDASGAYVEAGPSGGGAAVEDARWDYFKPAAPTGVTATAGNAQAVVSWTAPAIVVPPLTDYVVQYSSDSGSTWTTFSDGTSTATTATVTGLTNGTAYQFRVAGVNGLGTGAFSTASAAVTPIAGDPLFSSVALLLPFDGTGNTFVDASAVPKAITAAGNATQSTAQSKWGGRSAYFDGSGDYLTAAVPAFGTSDFVVEMWVYFNSIQGDYTGLFDARPSQGAYPTIILDGSSIKFFTNSAFRINGGTVATGQWQHIALARSSGTTRLYLNGSQTGSSYTDANNYLSSVSPVIGSLFDGYGLNGYIDDLRITVGSARGYTGATITVPTAAFPTRGIYEDPFFESVSLLLPMDGTGSTFVDSSLTPKAITAVGNATQSATESKWGGKSAFFNDADDGISFPDVGIGTGDFCIEMWFKTASTVQYAQLIGNEAPGGTPGFSLLINNNSASGGQIALYGAGRQILASPSGDFSDDQWHHIAVSRSGSTMRLYLDGTLASTGTSSYSFNSSAAMFVARNNAFAPRNMVGYIDDLRITKGHARYTANFTVPTAAFPTS